MSHYCAYCGSRQHNVEMCPKTAGGQCARANLHCTYCGANDHDVTACPKTYTGNAARYFNEQSVAGHFVKDR